MTYIASLGTLPFIFMCIAGFIAAFVDSIAGGGGIISVPAYMLLALPQANVIGTNKFSASCGSLMSSINFIKQKKADFTILKYTIPCIIIGCSLGVKVALILPNDFFKSISSVLIIIIAIYTFLSKNLGIKNEFKEYKKLNMFIMCILSSLIGFYDGFFGPGTGTFFIFALIKLFGFEFTNAAGTAKLMNFTSNILSLILYAFAGRIIFILAIPVGICAAIGAKLGTNAAIKHGPKFIKPIFIIIAFLTAIKMFI